MPRELHLSSRTLNASSRLWERLLYLPGGVLFAYGLWLSLSL